MKLSEIYQIADAIAPKALSDEYCEKYGAYDNSGVLVDTGEEITGIVFTLDFSFQAIEKAMERNANLIVTHHPAVYGKIGDLRVSDFDPTDEKLVKALRGGISVISMHLNLDGANGGIDECLAQGIALSSGAKTPTAYSLMHPLSSGGYGRVYDVQEIPFSTLAENMKKTFSTCRVLTYGDGEVKRVASFCGAGADEQAVEFACRSGADTIVSSDFKHHVLTLALEKGLKVIALTHYASENYGFRKYYEKISQSIALPCTYYTDERVL